MFLIEFLGDLKLLSPKDNEISEITFLEKEKAFELLSHQDIRDYFSRHI